MDLEGLPAPALGGEEVRPAWASDWGCKSPTDPLEGTVSQRQLHEDLESSRTEPARACGMEARGQPQHRTQVKPRKAGPTWVSVPPSTTPDIQSRRDGIGDGGGGTWLVLTRGDLDGSAVCGGGAGHGNALP